MDDVDNEKGTKNPSFDSGRPIAIDPQAESTTDGVPAFIARPEGALVYYGFPTLDDVQIDGFTLGKISDFEAEPDMEIGDAFVVAPAGTRAGLIWEVSDEGYFREVMPFEEGRWGVWAVTFPHAMTNRENARRNLESILPRLRENWELWRQAQG